MCVYVGRDAMNELSGLYTLAAVEPSGGQGPECNSIQMTCILSQGSLVG